jgi:putative ABC transport system permease protein
MLAIMGVYAVISYVTAQRTGEFAVRAALGAPPSSIVRLVLGSAAKLALIGAVIGVALALAMSRVMKTLLFGTKTTDAVTYAVVLGLLLRRYCGLQRCRRCAHRESIRWSYYVRNKLQRPRFGSAMARTSQQHR